MNKRYIICLIVSTMLACIFAIPVFAEGETATYINFEGCEYLTSGVGPKYVSITGSGRAVNIIWNNFKASYIVSDHEFMYNYSSSACPTNHYEVSTTNYGGTTYWYIQIASGNNYIFNEFPMHEGGGIPGVNYQSHAAIYFTYGAGAVEPVEPINWGLLRDVEYGTRVAGNGEASRQNIDYLSWNTLLDTNGNDISECEVEIRAVYGKWTGNTTEDVIGMDYQDLAISGNVTLATLDASVGTYSVRWQDVVNALNSWDFEDLSTHAVNNQIEKNGWYYEIMLLPPDGTQGQWQIVYTPLSSSAESSEIILNHNSFDMSVNQVYQHLTQINNSTSITINIEGTDYTIQNPDDGEEPEGGTDNWDLLKQILNAIFQTIKAITSLPAKIAEKLLDTAQLLITPPATYDGSLAQMFDQEYEEYMSSKQQTIYDFLEGVEDLEPYINGRIPANQGAHECIITWEDVKLDLTPFGAGEVTFINGGTHNLTDTFLRMLGGFGLTYADYEGLVTGFLYLAIAAFIYRNFVIFLRKS